MLLKIKYIGVFFILSSCSLLPKSQCQKIVIDKEDTSGRVQSGLSKLDNIYSVSIELKGNITQTIFFNEFKLKKGKIDTVFKAQDHYSPDFFYEIQNPSKGSGELDFCITFFY
ncbi:MAG: hypothetical protein P8O16_04765 [Algoriphagus sp.]|jgi:hypothetical protein|uniref:hypothetical protein n=1 Tax=Algoriphagus sp. TaxID=1872435 RepID=UPI0026197E2A|nr:hypothetical protein [Algoriphagus sp.]MDG1276570.1 hypothetical protein [Algoriphagus sp.]